MARSCARCHPLLLVVNFACALAISVCCLGDARGESPPVDFQRDIQPIFAEHCTLCHGVDEADRKGGLRLDLREAALRGGDSGEPAVVPGSTDRGELWRRITSTDAAEQMPPPDHNKPLSAKQIETLRRWIAEGAPFAGHWAFESPQKLALPEVGVGNPVDAWVLAGLRRRGLELSPEADAATLCRRLYLDVIGLPPSPEQLAAFERDGYEATLDALLADPGYGEKWARHWLDVARYSDTNGYEKDLRRDQWAWRDWVVAALNDDLPYDRFLVEQIAGDLLPEATQAQVVATGFLRNSMINEEGAIVPEQFRMVEMFDRLDCIGKAVLGISTQCAQCHSHKFDPLTQREYYGMFAYLNNSFEAQSWVYSEEQRQRIAEIRRGLDAARDRVRAARPDWQGELAAWEQGLAAARPTWTPLEFFELGSVSGLNHPTQEADHSLLMKGHGSADIFGIARPPLKGVTGLRLEILTHGDLPHTGPGRSAVGGWGVSTLEVLVRAPGGEFQPVKLSEATADESAPEQKHDEGKRTTGPVALLIDGKDETTWTVARGVGRRNQPSVAVVRFEQPLSHPEGTELKVVMRMTDMVGCCRISLTSGEAPVAPTVPQGAMLVLDTAPADRTAEQTAALFDAWVATVPELAAQLAEMEELWKGYPQGYTSVLHLQERPESMRRTTSLLDRGSWDHPLDPVPPGIPAAFHPFPEGAPDNRLGFALWLADRRSPWTARVAVNRAWQVLFGTGLVETAEDLGTRSPAPEYRELLDWLAVDFMERGWRQKELLRQILLSAVYRQTSRITPELREADPQNRWLARGPRFRADAEVVRDIALTASGLLSRRVGGAPVIPPVPQNVLNYNYVVPGYWQPATGPDRYRRTLYGFRKRSMPDPVMSSFDGPNGDFACARRVRSNTPLAALTGLNEEVFVECARALALRVLREAPADDAARIDHAYVLCMSRRPSTEERDEVLSLLKSRRQRLAEGWLNPRELLSGDLAKLPELPAGATPQDAAAWTLVARVLLNLDETLSKN